MITEASQIDPTELARVRALITELSGGGKRLAPGARHNGIYCTMNLPGLDDMGAVRNAVQRWADFGLPDDMTGKSFIDVGSNVGAMALEVARRGALVNGVEYRQDRVDLCNKIADLWQLNAQFFQADFNQEGWRESTLQDGTYDVVLCSAVDNYLDDPQGFYEELRALVNDTGHMYFECNRNRGSFPAETTIDNLKRAGFARVEYLGIGSCPFLRRKIFRAYAA